jgi:hypothetical protein
MTVLAWKEPPPATSTDWPAVDAQLRTHPGDWALVSVCTTEAYAVKLTSELRFGKSQGAGQPRTVRLELGAFEVERRGCEVYARFTGGAA